jgi:hypothetical protein
VVPQRRKVGDEPCHGATSSTGRGQVYRQAHGKNLQLNVISMIVQWYIRRLVVPYSYIRFVKVSMFFVRLPTSTSTPSKKVGARRVTFAFIIYITLTLAIC